MRLSLVKSKNTTQFYVIKSYRDKNGKNTSKIIEKLGNTEEVTKKAKGKDPIVWAKKYIEGLNKAEKENNLKILIEKSTSTLIPKNEQNLFNCGYLFLEKIYPDLDDNYVFFFKIIIESLPYLDDAEFVYAKNEAQTLWGRVSHMTELKVRIKYDLFRYIPNIYFKLLKKC